MQKGRREVRAGEWSQGGAGMGQWDNGLDHFKIHVSSQEKMKTLYLRKGQQPLIWNLKDCIINYKTTPQTMTVMTVPIY